MSPEPFDELDRALAGGLSALAPDVREGDETLDALRPRFERARRRVQLARAGGVVGALVIVGSLAAVMVPHSARTRVSVSSPSSTPGTTVRRVQSSTTITTASTTTTSTPTTVSSTVAPTAGATGAAPGTIPDRGHGPAGATPTTFSGGGDHEYQSAGGSISVRFSNGALTLVHVSPDNGLAEDVRDRGPDRVEVRFTLGGSEKARIEIRVENGHLVRIAHSDG